MKRKYLILIMVFLLSLIPTFIYSQSVVERHNITCNYDSDVRDEVEKRLLEAYKNAVNAILDGKEGRKLCQCKIDEIKPKLANIKYIEYGCGGDLCTWACGKGNPKNSFIIGVALLLICDPWATIQTEHLKPSLCGSLEGLMVHEIIHATTDGSEEEAVDCSKILYPNAADPWGLETPDHRNCACANK